MQLELIEAFEDLAIRYGETLLKVRVLEELAIENGWTSAENLKQRFKQAHEKFYEELKVEAQSLCDERNLRERPTQ